MDNFILVNIILIWVILIFNFIITLAIVKRITGREVEASVSIDTMLRPNEDIPNFTVLTIEEQIVTQENYKGQNKALVFISSTCGPCISKLPHLEDTYYHAQNSGIELLIFNLEDVAKTQTLISEFGLSIPILSTAQFTSSMMQEYKIPGTPSYYYIVNDKIIEGGLLGKQWDKLVSKWSTN